MSQCFLIIDYKLTLKTNFQKSILHMCISKESNSDSINFQFENQRFLHCLIINKFNQLFAMLRFRTTLPSGSANKKKLKFKELFPNCHLSIDDENAR